MLGAITGDIIGSVHEYLCGKSTQFPLFVPESDFTDDSVLTVAVADCLLTGAPYVDKLREYALVYPGRGYGGRFSAWVRSGSREPYDSWGNGAAMRVSAVGYAFDTMDAVLLEARRCAEATHDHPEGIRGAQATAAGILLARQQESKKAIRRIIQESFGYDLERTIDSIRPTYTFDESCQGTVPEAFIAFLDSTDYEGALRLAISLGGDADTLACITGGIAEAYYGGIPAGIEKQALARLDERLRQTVQRFRAAYVEWAT